MKESKNIKSDTRRPTVLPFDKENSDIFFLQADLEKEEDERKVMMLWERQNK